MSKMNAVAVRRFTVGDTSILKGAIIRDMAADQFSDLKSVGLVREATTEDLAEPAVIAHEPEAEKKAARAKA